jgi:hypothetical protein
LTMLSFLPVTTGLHVPARGCTALAVVLALARRSEVRTEGREHSEI